MSIVMLVLLSASPVRFAQEFHDDVKREEALDRLHCVTCHGE